MWTTKAPVSSSLLQSDYSVKVLNTENIVLSLANINVDNNDDLEMIQNYSENPKVIQKLSNFHRYIGAFDLPEPAQIPTNEFYTTPPSLLDKPMPKNNNFKLKIYEKWKKAKSKFLTKLKNRRLFWKEKCAIRKREVDKGSATEPTNLDAEYQDFVANTKENGAAYKYTDEGKPEESFRDIMNKLVDFKMPKNCSNVTGIGIQALQCLYKSASINEISRREMYQKTSIIILIWCCIYLAVAVPLWCVKGWCCCCFRCSFCFPRKTISEIEKYITENPPGVYINSKGEEEHYNPNVRETELYENIKRAIEEF